MVNDEASPTRGIILLPEGIRPVPPYVLSHERTLWPPGMPIKGPGEPTHFVQPTDLYERVRLIKENLYVFVPGNLDPSTVIEEYRSRINEWLDRNPS